MHRSYERAALGNKAVHFLVSFAKSRAMQKSPVLSSMQHWLTCTASSLVLYDAELENWIPVCCSAMLVRLTLVASLKKNSGVMQYERKKKNLLTRICSGYAGGKIYFLVIVDL